MVDRIIFINDWIICINDEKRLIEKLVNQKSYVLYSIDFSQLNDQKFIDESHN